MLERVSCVTIQCSVEIVSEINCAAHAFTQGVVTGCM